MASRIPSGEIRTILDEHYGIKLGKVQKVTARISNHVLIASSSLGKLVIRLPQGQKTDCAEIDLEARVTSALIDSELPVRRIVKTYDGKNFVLAANGTPITVFKFISGKFLDKVERQHLEEAGKVLRQIHETLSNFENRGQLIHGDFNPGNFVWTADKISGILDLEHVRAGQVEEDLATLTAHYIFLLPCFNPNEVIKGILTGYGNLSIMEFKVQLVKTLEWLASWQVGKTGYFAERIAATKQGLPNLV